MSFLNVPKHYIIILVFLIFFLPKTNAQIKFEPGYIINNDNKKIECLVKNQDWVYAPESVAIKANPGDRAQLKAISEIKEFSIPGQFRYIRTTVDIDQLSDLLDDNEMSDIPDPVWKKQTVYLKVLVQGEITLLVYEKTNFTRFFYQLKNRDPQQLIYKRYRPAESLNFKYNKEYIHQLQQISSCKTISENDINQVAYTQNDLVNYFMDINDCMGNPGFVYKRKKQHWFYLKPIIGYNFGSFATGNSLDTSVSNVTFKSSANFMAGLEFEFILPFNTNEWSFPVDISSFSYNATGTKSNGTAAVINYNTIDISGGFRHYFFLNDDFKILLDLRYTKDIKVRIGSLSAGAGLGYKKIYLSTELFLKKRMDDPYDYFSDHRKFKVWSVSLKYAIF